MVVVTPAEGHQYRVDGILHGGLEQFKRDIKRYNQDKFIVVDGREGRGKSTLAGQIALFMDNTFTLDRCVFTIDQFEEAVMKATRGQVIVFDETMGYLSARGAMSRFNKRLIKIFSEMRSRNLIVILCIPSFFELDRYAAIHRSNMLITVTKMGGVMGCFKAYGYNKKKEMYLKGKKGYSYCVRCDFFSNFGKHFVYDEEEYEKKKREAQKEFTKDTKSTSVKRAKKWQKQRWMLVATICDKFDTKPKEIAKIIGESVRNVRICLENGRNLISKD